MTAEEVKALQVGTRVDMIGKDPEGNERCIQCTVAFRGSPANKFLTYRDKGVIKHCAIKDYPGKQYMRVSGDRESGLLSAGSTPAALAYSERKEVIESEPYSAIPEASGLSPSG